MHLTEKPFTQASKRQVFGTLKDLIHEGRFELLDDKKLIRELRSLEQRASPTGNVQVSAPRYGGATDDLATVTALVASEVFGKMGNHGVFKGYDLS